MFNSLSVKGPCEPTLAVPLVVMLPLFLIFPAGLWLYLAGSDLPCLTLIGSPNFGYRSVHRDLEAQVAIVTENKALQQQLHQVSSRFWGCIGDVALQGHMGNADDAVAIKTSSYNNSKSCWSMGSPEELSVK